MLTRRIDAAERHILAVRPTVSLAIAKAASPAKLENPVPRRITEILVLIFADKAAW